MYVMEEFVVVNAPMDSVEEVITSRELMRRWASPSVQFTPKGEWSFEEGSEWTLTLTGLGMLLPAHYVVYERRPGLILWSYTGFWEGFDAWHWMPNVHRREQTIIQNRLEYRLRVPLLHIVWSAVMVPLMNWDARIQMKRLKGVCESYHALRAARLLPSGA